MNHRELLGDYRNSRLVNLLGIAVVLVTVGLGLWKILQVLNIF